MLECRDIKGFENYFRVYNNGIVESYDRVDRLGRVHKSGIIKPFTIKDGYLAVKLSKNGIKTPPIPIARLVYETFVGEIPNNYDVHHKNHIRTDNRVENLELIESSKHKSIHRSQYNVETKSKPILQYNKDGELLFEYPSISEASRQSGISITAIHNCLSGRSKTSGGYLWKYK